MTDDIVTRLRMPICGNYDDDHPSWGPQPCSSCVEAADEIERLRYLVHHYKGQAETYGNALDRINEANSKTKVVKGPNPDAVYPQGSRHD